MQPNLIHLLTRFDLTDKQAHLYLAALQTGPTTAYEIAKQSGLKRPTVYILLEELKAKSLVSAELRGEHTLWSAISPEELVRLWRSNVSSLEQLLPELKSYQNNQPSRMPKIRVFEGEPAVEAFYREIIMPGPGQEILFASSIGPLSAKLPHLFRLWENAVKNGQRARELIASDAAGAKYLRKMQKIKNQQYSIRFLDSVILGQADVAIVGTRLALISLTEALFVTIIDSQAITQTISALFEAAWQSAV